MTETANPEPNESGRLKAVNRRYICIRCRNEKHVNPRFETEEEVLKHLKEAHGDVNDGKYDYTVNVGEWPDE